MPSKIVFWARIAEANDKFHRVDYNANMKIRYENENKI